MAGLPSEIITDILSRLPVKPLLRFRCVCKPWCALIDSSKFMKMHLSRSVQTLNNLSLVLNSTEPRPYSIDFDSLDRAVELDHPLRSVERRNLTQVWGSCNGLLCLVEANLANAEEHVVLWNPSTKKHWKLPDSPIETRSFFCIWGFGFDTITDDYKVLRVMISPFHGVGPKKAEVKIYSLKSNSWKSVLDFPPYLAYVRAPAELASEALHWVVTVKPHNGDLYSLVLAFDLGAEGFRIVPQPEYEDTKNFSGIGVLQGFLCAFCNNDQVGFDIWMMKVYGVKESWTKLISVKLSDVVRSLVNLQPIAFSKNGGKVLIQHDKNQFSWYDMKRKIMERVRIRDIPDQFITFVCCGSLVPLGGASGSAGKKQPTQDKTMKKNDPKKRDDFLSKGFKLVL